MPKPAVMGGTVPGGSDRGGGSCSLPGGSSAVSAAGQRACHEAAVKKGEKPQGYASHVQIDALGDGSPGGAPPVLLLERPTQTGSVVW